MDTTIMPVAGAMRWTNYTLDTHIAPSLSAFNSVVIEDLTAKHPEAEHWWANFTLNTILGGGFSREGMLQAALGVLRRVGGAFSAYHRAREITTEYVTRTQQGEQPIRKYYLAVDEWESFVLQVQMAMALMRWMGGEDLFGKNDGSVEQRIYTMANHIKHTDSCIEAKQLTQTHTIPLWLSNNGLESFGISISFKEAAEVLIALAEVADKLQNPRGLAESVNAEDKS